MPSNPNTKTVSFFFRLGDFYEMFNEDAQIASKVLDITLTARGKGSTNTMPMCGFPYHSAESYISKLIKAGYKVAICDQIEDASTTKNIVKRDVTRIITSGTYLDEHNYTQRLLLSLNLNGKKLGLAFTDPSNGVIHTNQMKYDINTIIQLLVKLPIYECIFPENIEKDIRHIFDSPSLKLKNITLSFIDNWSFNIDTTRRTLLNHYNIKNLHSFGIENLPYAISTAGALLEYLKQLNKQPLKHMDKISLYSDDTFAWISPAAYKGLELDSVVKALDHTKTPLGKRKFIQWFFNPLKHSKPIIHRQEAITHLLQMTDIHNSIKKVLNLIPDIEKNISRLSYGYKNPKDLLAIRNTLTLTLKLNTLVKSLHSENTMFTCNDVPDLRILLENAINEDIPLTNADGKVIRKGFNKDLDDLYEIQNNGRHWLKEFQKKEIESTNIPSLKVGYNKVFGYYIEITKIHIQKIPNHYIRRQTLTNAERYITPELKEYEEKVLCAQEKILTIETTLIDQIQQKILSYSLDLHKLCESIANIDCISSLTDLANTHNYTRPIIYDDTRLNIQDGRHPVVEKNITDDFIANDTNLNCEDKHFLILTGPNMAGKSTYIRQSAILVIMAQIGSFIPAKEAHIGLVDKFFTRIGAHDDITRGQSTFMVEMNETADILNNLTDKSLIIIDEIGRGTSTSDGLSLAWALAEHLQESKARTLFATHFHELTALSQTHTGTKNYTIAVKEWNDEIIFLHKIIEGSIDDSYGIYVAKLAGIPKSIILRARQILKTLEKKHNTTEFPDTIHTSSPDQKDLLNTPLCQSLNTIKDILTEININTLSPIEALSKLNELKDIINEERQSLTS